MQVHPLLTVVLCPIFGLLLTSGCEHSPVLKDVSAAEALTIIETSEADLVIIDVRTPAEFAGIHVRNAMNIDFFALDFQTGLGALDRRTPYLVYCGSGTRSSQAAYMMKQMGFTEVYNVEGGMTALNLLKQEGTDVPLEGTCSCVSAADNP